MKLTDRDIKIINFIKNNQGATIGQLQKLFFPSYNMTAKRLKLLLNNKFLKAQMHPVLGKKVYYLKKLPSFHTLVITDMTILLKDKIKFMQREYKIKNNYIDCIFILKEGKIIILEVDIYNRTKETKIKEILKTLAETKAVVEFWVVCRCERRAHVQEIKYIKINDIKNIKL
ncbi:hypothetical protein AB8U03_15805 [Clostridium sp. Mt-5]|uniref:Uncharacterized protein n=1 Tax=Clostridium moutaii TaxID=3240932 RepID=A0ABV4BVV6_9CLOT